MMKKVLFIFVLFSLCLFAKEFKVATYNVENLFDLQRDGTEYKEFIPFSKTWNKKAFYSKLKNISTVINHLNADIIALQEVESQNALEALLNKTSQYKYNHFIKKNTSSVGVAILSKFPIQKIQKIVVDKYDKYARDILKATITIENKDIIIYVNHWRSKRASESKRIVYATSLKRELDSLDNSSDYIILGDLNSNYDEYLTFKYDKKLNDTYGITGINQVLNTTINENFIKKTNILDWKNNVHYNLWLDLEKEERFSSKFRGENNTPDNIIISSGLFDSQNISYVNNSFAVFKAKYLFKKQKIYRWDSKTFEGYSDHLPIYAVFSTNKQIYNEKIDNQVNINSSIAYLYNIQSIDNYLLKDAVVVYKSKNIAVIKKKNDRAIMIYKPSLKFKTGYSYDIVIEKIDEYNGLKEIKEISVIEEKKKIQNYQSYYVDGRSIDLFDRKYQNEIIKNLRGIYKRGYLYFKNSDRNGKIKLYFDKKIKRPEDGKNITISSGHLSIYKSKVQITLHKQSDFY